MIKKIERNEGTIGVFDSGIGGLTVLKALQSKFPSKSYIYIGDTARLPYGTKSPETIIRYSETLTRALLKHNISAIVVACNTASTHALSAVEKMAGNIPVLGMIEPASRAALMHTKNNHIGVLATFGTVQSGAYEKKLKQLKTDIKVSSVACQMLVALAEEGWTEGDIAESALRKYLEPMFKTDAPDTLILGCTHFPLFEGLLRKILGDKVVLINSGAAAADELEMAARQNGTATTKFFATDDPARFAKNAEKFFNRPLTSDEVELIDI